MNLVEMKQKKAEAVAEIKKLSDLTAKESRDFTAEEKSAWEKANADFESFSGRIAIQERADQMAEPVNAITSVKTPEIGMTKKEQKNYSLLKAIEATRSGDWRNAGFERELSEECAKTMGRTAQGFFAPFDIFKRDLIAGTTTLGGFTVPTNLMGGSFIDLLRNRMVCATMGAQTLSGLSGNFAVPKLTVGSTLYWVAENLDVTESTQTLAQLTMTPKTCGTFTDLSRRLIIQSSIDVENMVRNDLLATIAIGLDKQGLEGTGASNTPTGVGGTTGIGLVAWGSSNTPTFAKFVDMETEVAKDNALAANMGYVFNSTVAGFCKQTAKVASTDSRMIMEAGEINGYKVLVSEQAAAYTAYFGNFADLIFGIWGNGVDINIDTSTGSKAGTVRVVALMDADVGIRRAQSFCKANNSGS